MVRKTQSKSPGKKSRKSDPDISREDVMFTPYSETSVHKRNLCIVSFPIIFLFNILRSLLYQIFVILRFVYCSSSNYLIKKRQFECESGQSTCVVEEITEMSHQVHRSSGPGPGDPLLAKQKHHHRRAFEYISKALKIDEENEGWPESVSGDEHESLIARFRSEGLGHRAVSEGHHGTRAGHRGAVLGRPRRSVGARAEAPRKNEDQSGDGEGPAPVFG